MENQMITCEACGMETPKMKLCSFCGEPLGEELATSETLPMPRVEDASGVNEILKDAQVMAAIDAVRSGTYGGATQAAASKPEPEVASEASGPQTDSLSEDTLGAIAEAVAAKLADNQQQEQAPLPDKDEPTEFIAEKIESVVEETPSTIEKDGLVAFEVLENDAPQSKPSESIDAFEEAEPELEEPVIEDAPEPLVEEKRGAEQDSEVYEEQIPLPQLTDAIKPITVEPSLEIALPVPTRKLFFSDESEQLLYMAVLGYMYYTLPSEIQNMDTMLKILTECNNRERLEQLIKDYKVSIVTRYGNENVARNTDEWFVVRQFEKYQSNVAVR